MKLSILGLAAFLLLTAIIAVPAARAEGPQAALLYTNMKGVAEEKKEASWSSTKKVMAQYFTLLPDERVIPAQDRARSAGCDGEACLEAVRKDLGVPVALQLRHIDEGYFHQLFVTRVNAEGAREKHYTCSRCTPQEFQVILNRLMRTFDEPQH
jgi:hypothetical protein